MFDEYNLIKNYYGEDRATRSQVPLINHIDEGLAILDEIYASEMAKRAFCLHPIVQSDVDFDVSWSKAYKLALEYRDRANSYLCTPENDHITTIEQLHEILGPMSQECVEMLYADKKQNQKDFYAYHKDTHERAEQLDSYFKLWIDYLTSYYLTYVY